MTKDELLKTRFVLNMRRINSLTQLLFSSEALKHPGLFQDSEGVRAEILRATVVFLHATFEVVLRNHLPRPNKRLTFYSSKDLDKALKLSGIDAKPFRGLYPPLIQMAKRRNRIVHEADLSKSTDTVSKPWGIADDWQLIMWLMAVPAFYYRLRMSTNAASVVERKQYETYRRVMMRHVDFGNQILAFPRVPPEMGIKALLKIAAFMKRSAGILESGLGK